MKKQEKKRADGTRARRRDPETDPGRQTRADAGPVISGADGIHPKVFLTEKPVAADVYPVLDTDLARDNAENDLPAADREEL